MGRLVVALRAYQDVNGRLPPAVVYGPLGTPWHSWRVLILPYIEQAVLFNEFRLHEPWNSPHNLRLAERRPLSYGPPRRKENLIPHDHTICHVLVGKGTPFDPPESQFDAPKGRQLPADFPDGTANTLLLVEAGEPVLWTKPEDLPYDPAGPLPPLRGLFKDGFRACTADGKPVFIRYDTPEDVLRAAITRGGGERLPNAW